MINMTIEYYAKMNWADSTSTLICCYFLFNSRALLNFCRAFLIADLPPGRFFLCIITIKLFYETSKWAYSRF